MSSPSRSVQTASTPRPEPVRAGRAPGRLLVVSDRLPIVLTREGGEGWRAAPAQGALISALAPLLQSRRGVWIGWPGVAEEEAPGLRKVLAGAIREGYSLRPVSLGEREQRHCFGGFSGEIVWPLFHDLQMECVFSPASWQAYKKVNRRFARAVAKAVAPGGGTDLVWVHDHPLMNVAAELARMGTACRTAFFLHLPFPAPDLFLKLPWREEMMAGLLAYDHIGLQSERDLVNFLDCARMLVPGAMMGPCKGGLWAVRPEGRAGRETRLGVFPIGVAAREIEERAATPEVGARVAALRQSLHGRRLILGVDRLDRTKGIPEKLRALAEALTRYPDLREKVSLVQVVLPSREGLPRHAALRAEIERLVGEINGYFSRPGWVPVHYLHRTLAPEELLAYYRVADVALITPLKAGMNLPAKEYCAANLEERGALVLSEFAGAAAQLSLGGRGAFLVNPHDAQATARTLRKALRLKPEERGARMRALRGEVRRHDVFWWADTFLDAAFAEGAERTGSCARAGEPL